MRVSTNLIQMRGLQNILDKQADLLRQQDELSRGEKIIKKMCGCW